MIVLGISWEAMEVWNSLKDKFQNYIYIYIKKNWLRLGAGGLGAPKTTPPALHCLVPALLSVAKLESRPPKNSRYNFPNPAAHTLELFASF